MTSVDQRYPGGIQELWQKLDVEVTWLHGRWIIYRQLFGTSPERVELLNAAAGTFANVLQDILLQDVQLALSKLGDPAGSGKRENMTLSALHESLLLARESAAAVEFNAAMQMFEIACVKVKRRRNKWIAHFDRTTMLNEAVDPRMGPSREEIENAREALRAVMNCLSVRYTGTTIAYEHFTMPADGSALLRSLRQGLRYSELVKAGVVPRDDYIKRFSGQD